MKPIDPRELALRVPDEPLWVDFRGLLLSRCGKAWADEAGWAARANDRGLAVVVGRPGAELLAEVAGAPVVLAMPDDADGLAGRLGRVERKGTVLHVRDDSPRPGSGEGARNPEEKTEGKAPSPFSAPEAPPAGEGMRAPQPRSPSGHVVELRLVSPLDPFLAPEFGPELEREWAASRSAGMPLAVAFDEDRVVAVCSSAFETESYWDVSVDTLPSHRRQGLAAAAFGLLTAEMARHGKHPVWGSEEGNDASLALAARLGFRPVGRLVVFERSGEVP